MKEVNKANPAKKAVVIGAGIAGIAVAIRLANKKYAVEVYEQNAYPGGKLSNLKCGGYRFDAGPSLFTLPHLVDELFTLSGKNPGDYFNYKKKEEVCRYFWDDNTSLIAYADKEKFAEEIVNKLGIDKKIILRYLKHSAFAYNITRPVFLENSLHILSNYFKWHTIKGVFALPFLNIFSSMHAVNTKKLKHPKLIQYFNRYATYNGSNPYKAPGILTMIPHLEHNIGTYIPEQGMHSITQSLYKLACELGVKFNFESVVNKIITKDKTVIGIVANNHEVYADIVVCNSDIFPAYRNLLKQEHCPEKILQQERSSSALIFYWGIKKTFSNLGLHNIFFSNDYEAEFKSIFETKELYHDPTVYINITSKDIKNDAPEGCENWFVMVNVPHSAEAYSQELITRMKEQILLKISKILCCNIEAYIETEAFLTPKEIEQKTSSYRGSLYGTSSNTRNAAFLRHANFSSDIKNLYFCGGSVHPGGGIPLCLYSAKIVSGLIR